MSNRVYFWTKPAIPDFLWPKDAYLAGLQILLSKYFFFKLFHLDNKVLRFPKIPVIFWKIEDNILGQSAFGKSCRPCWAERFDVSFVILALKIMKLYKFQKSVSWYSGPTVSRYRNTKTLITQELLMRFRKFFFC